MRIAQHAPQHCHESLAPPELPDISYAFHGAGQQYVPGRRGQDNDEDGSPCVNRFHEFLLFITSAFLAEFWASV